MVASFLSPYSTSALTSTPSASGGTSPSRTPPTLSPTIAANPPRIGRNRRSTLRQGIGSGLLSVIFDRLLFAAAEEAGRGASDT